MGIDLFANNLRQRLLLQQVTELQQGGRVRYRLNRQISADKVAQCLTVIDRVFQRFVR